MNPVWVDEQEMNEHLEDNENAHTVGEQMDGQTAKGVREPRQPTQKERREHSLTHVPNRNWSEACVLSLKRKSTSGTEVIRKKAPRQDHDSTGPYVSLQGADDDRDQDGSRVRCDGVGERIGRQIRSARVETDDR